MEDFTGGFSGNFNLTDNANKNSGNNNNSSNSSTSGASTTSSSQYDNYNHYNRKSTQLTSGSTFYGDNGTTAVVNTNSNGSQTLQITLPGSSSPVTFSPQKSSTNTSSQSSTVESYTNFNQFGGTVTQYYGPNGAKATIINTNNGQKAIKVTTSNGTYYYYSSGTPSNSNISSRQYYANQYYGPYGGSAGSVTGPKGNTAYYAQGPYGTSVAGVTSKNGYTAGSVTGPKGNTAYYAQGPAGNTVAGTSLNSNYNSSLPPGIPRSQIPPGDEDLYILKSEIVPPVCPVCPSPSTRSREEPCPPCPACARCPEPSFECKKVPNYNAINSDYLPAPVLNDFSQFGM